MGLRRTQSQRLEEGGVLRRGESGLAMGGFRGWIEVEEDLDLLVTILVLVERPSIEASVGLLG